MSARAPAQPPARRRTQAERREEAERRLLEAAVQLVARRGSLRTTLAEIGEAAGYSRGLPAHRFGSKAGLLRALAAHIGERFDAQRQAAPAREPGLDTIRGSVELYFNRTDANWTSTRALLVMMTEALIEPPGLADDLAAYNRSALAFFEHHIRVGVERGEIDPGVDPAADAVVLLGALRGAMLQWLLDRDIDLGRVRDRMLEVVDRSLLKR